MTKSKSILLQARIFKEIAVIGCVCEVLCACLMCLMRTGLTKCDRVFMDRSAKLCQSQRNLRSEKSVTRANKKAEDFSSASFRLVPSPRYFAKSNLTGAGFRFQRKR